MENKIYDVLVTLGGALESQRESFCRAFNDKSTKEWRFQGKLGFGGKYRFPTNRVDCYQEDDTPVTFALIVKINTELEKIKI